MSQTLINNNKQLSASLTTILTEMNSFINLTNNDKKDVSNNLKKKLSDTRTAYQENIRDKIWTLADQSKRDEQAVMPYDPDARVESSILRFKGVLSLLKEELQEEIEEAEVYTESVAASQKVRLAKSKWHERIIDIEDEDVLSCPLKKTSYGMDKPQKKFKMSVNVQGVSVKVECDQ